jgi:tetratricopeptide (TPR) repeat protein
MKRVTIEESDSDDDDEQESSSSATTETQPSSIVSQRSTSWKDTGNEAFKKGDFQHAIQCYTTSLREDPKQPAVYSNRAMVELQLQQYESAVADCGSGLECAGFTSVQSLQSAYSGQEEEYDVIRKLVVKLLYRRGLGLKHLGKMSAALQDMENALELEPSNERVVKEVTSLKSKRIGGDGDSGTGVTDTSTVESQENSEEKDSNHGQHADAFETATRISGKLLSQIAVPAPPQTAYEFESVCNSFRNDMEKLAKYVKQVKPVKLKKLFKRPIESDTLSRLIYIAEYIIKNHDDAKFAVDLLKGLSKTPNFSMTAMMLESVDQNRVQEILDCYNEESPIVHKIREAYKLPR